ncbi:hypothetical protein BCR43DRAFT_312821 [Syncephalastrum racemosum]|uniref:Uncharacterized protein n=1 Tax=Syncephalastrum racemosum TaxID=13706 RepID=A0A1X2HAW4_SYNRA|nr:hypothetical protein BCR43DRAFT_312821 [Syncephalastrum racemosum]
MLIQKRKLAKDRVKNSPERVPTAPSRDPRACLLPKVVSFFIPGCPFFIIVAFHSHLRFCFATLFLSPWGMDYQGGRWVCCVCARA